MVLGRPLYSFEVSKKMQEEAQPYKTKSARRRHFLVVQVGFQGWPKGPVLGTQKTVQRGLQMGLMGPRGCGYRGQRITRVWRLL
ncbi:mCG1036087 [Mus musculus]|jgi:hypothetical protein|nr:mCG1036087 [Mus musculus]